MDSRSQNLGSADPPTIRENVGNQVQDTWITPPKALVSTTNRTACLVHIYPSGPTMGTRYVLGESEIIVGRDVTSDICVEDQSVSRRHAQIKPAATGHYLIDLKSRNGSFVNDRPASLTKLKDGDYLRFGNWIFRYLAGGNIESEYHEEIYRLTIVDGLTGVHNKRYLEEFLDRELARSARHSRPLSLILFDIDHFKKINDTLGHLAGDHVLRELTGCVKQAVAMEELFARYGGEEFAIVLPETRIEEAKERAEDIRQRVANHSFQFDSAAVPVTISLGVVCTAGESEINPSELIRRADEMLYQAKHTGRNRVAG